MRHRLWPWSRCLLLLAVLLDILLVGRYCENFINRHVCNLMGGQFLRWALLERGKLVYLLKLDLCRTLVLQSDGGACIAQLTGLNSPH